MLADSSALLQTERDYAESVYHLYPIRVADRDALMDQLRHRGISTAIHYPVPIHLQEAYRDLGYIKGSFPVTEQCAEQLLSLPMYAELTPELVEYVASAVTDILAEEVAVSESVADPRS